MSKLSECCTFQEGYVNPSQKIREYFGGPIKWLRTVDLNNGFVYDTSEHLSIEGFKSAGKSAYLFPENSISISKSGTIGELGIIKSPMCGNRAVINIVPQEEKVDLMYLFYLLKYKKNEIVSKAVGSIQKNLYISELSQISLNHNNLQEQRRISNILSLIDYKIENNKKIIFELESMAKTLYDYWFLQFEFPNEEGKPYKSSGGKTIYNEELKREIPEGWEVENMIESSLCFDIKAGVGKFESKNYLPTANIEGESITDGEYVTFDNRENRANMQPVKYSVWFAKMKNSIKHLSIPKNSEWFINKYILSTGFQGLKCTETSFAYIHSVINSSWFEIYKDILSHGATQEGVNNEDLKNIKFVVPSNKVLIEFNKICIPALERKFSIIRENQELASLRDFLLPMLMNGQVTFK